MLKTSVQIRDREIKIPESDLTLFDIKNAYIGTGQLAPELVEGLFLLVDKTVDRLIYTESERFRNDYQEANMIGVFYDPVTGLQSKGYELIEEALEDLSNNISHKWSDEASVVYLGQEGQPWNTPN